MLFLPKRITTFIFWKIKMYLWAMLLKQEVTMCLLFFHFGHKRAFLNINLFSSKSFLGEKSNTKSHSLDGHGYWGQTNLLKLLHITISNSYSNRVISIGEIWRPLVSKLTSPPNGLLPLLVLGWVLTLLCPNVLF